MKRVGSKIDDVNQADLFEGFKPAVHIPTQIVPGTRPGEWRVIAGKPQILQADDEISTAEAARITGLSVRRIVQQCDEGFYIEGQDFRRPGGPRGKYFLKRASVVEKSGRTLKS
jgi:hypothetical protein